MFRSARIKLTAYYLAIIALVMFVFSILAYRGFVYEFVRSLRIRHGGITLNIPPPVGMFIAPTEIDEPTSRGVFEEARRRVILNLLFLNTVVLSAAGFGGYFLAGKTLRPIEDMVEEQKRFVSDASHELRTPLTVLKTEIEVGLRNKNTSLKEAKRLLLSNLEEVEKMQRLANYLLVLSKYQYQGKLPESEMQKVNLKEVAQRSIKKLEVQAKKRKIKIEKNLGDVFVKGNEVALGELMVILIDNAIKYNYEGGKVKVATLSTREGAVLEVKDWGVGIKASELPYIFNRFYRADSSRGKERVNGYGLGLSIAKSIVDANCGEIKAISKPSQGTTFKVRFPVVL
jgi:signal transduction histidine kinase